MNIGAYYVKGWITWRTDVVRAAVGGAATRALGCLTLGAIVCLTMFAIRAPLAHAQPGDSNIDGDAEPQPGPSDFAYAIELEPTPGHALQTFVLPHEVLAYLTVSRAELSVFNQRGDRVPHAVRQLRSGADERGAERNVPFFPLYQAHDVRAGTPSRVEVQVRRNDDGRLVRVEMDDNTGKKTDGSPRQVVAYLFDTTELSPIERLRFQLTEHEPTFVWPVRLETSTDLTHFSPTRVSGSLLSLRHGDHDVQLQHLTLAGLKAKYLRLSWSTAKPPATIEAVTAELVPERTTPALHVQNVLGGPDPASPHDWLFDLGAALPISKLELVMGEPNTVIEAQLEARPTADVPFSSVYNGTFYRLEHTGTSLQSAAVEITPQYQRYVRARIGPRGGGLGSGRIELRAHVIPEQLLFVARGEGPFSLAFGHYGANISAFEDTELLSLVGVAASELKISSVKAGPVIELAGAAALSPPPPTTDYAKFVLWSVLGAAVLLLAVLSYRMFIRINGPNSHT